MEFQSRQIFFYKQTCYSPVSFPGLPTVYRVHHALYNPGHTMPLSTFGCIINVQPHAPFRQYTDQPGPSNPMLCDHKTLYHSAGPYSEGNTRKTLHIQALYSSQVAWTSTREYSLTVLPLPVRVYMNQHAATPTAILFHPADRQSHSSK